MSDDRLSETTARLHDENENLFRENARIREQLNRIAAVVMPHIGHDGHYETVALAVENVVEQLEAERHQVSVEAGESDRIETVLTAEIDELRRDVAQLVAEIDHLRTVLFRLTEEKVGPTIEGVGVWHSDDKAWIGFGATYTVAMEMIPDGYDHLVPRDAFATITALQPLDGEAT